MNQKNSFPIDLQQVTNLYSGIIGKRIYRSDSNYHFDILLTIDKNKGELTRKKLAKLRHLNQAYTNSIIYYLHAEGYINLMPGTADITETIISLTPKGTESIRQTETEINELNGKIAKDIGEERFALFIEILEKIKVNLKRESSVISLKQGLV